MIFETFFPKSIATFLEPRDSSMNLQPSQNPANPPETAGKPVDVPSPFPANTPWPSLPALIPRELQTLAAERARGESEVVSLREARNQSAGTSHRDQLAALKAETSKTQSQAEAEFDRVRNNVLHEYETETLTAREHDKSTRAKVARQAIDDKDEATQTHDQAKWEANALSEASEQNSLTGYERFQQQLADERSRFQLREGEAQTVLDSYAKYQISTDVPPDTEEPEPDSAEPLPKLREALTDVEERILELASLSLPQFLAGAGVTWLFLGPLIVLGVVLGFLINVWIGIPVAILVALASGFGIKRFLEGKARAEIQDRVPELLAALRRSEDLGRQCGEQGAGRLKAEREHLQVKRDTEIKKVSKVFARRMSEIEERTNSTLEALEESTKIRLEKAKNLRDQKLAEAEQTQTRKVTEVAQRLKAESARIESDLALGTKETEERYQREWSRLVTRWNGGLESAERAIDLVNAEASRRFLDWNQSPVQWKPSVEVPPALRFGQMAIDLEKIPHGVPSHAFPELTPKVPGTGQLPSLLTFPDRGSLLIRAAGAGKAAGVPILQGVMLRYLTSLPPGKIRFTILDPVGLGRHFAAFMHLADYSEQMVNSRIWTEPAQIEQRLADLSLHMENVIQQFLRNEFKTLEEYNHQAGEVAEPYRVLVVSHFPAHFQDQSAQRLMSLATGGARCGIYTLLMVDEDQPLPASVKIEELEAHAETLVWEPKRARFLWKNRDFAPFELEPDVPPADAVLTPLLHQIGEATRSASRVEVPFEAVAPSPDRYWTGDTRHGIDVALGRAGATKLQSMKLGRGTSQHVLIAGRTGSGKSSLLHALITNSALIYSPDEIEFYLIDFKKGVEFKTYAEQELPHARVIAIESEREFGLSVLQRLDEELTRRGDLFRTMGVQDMAGYREVPGAAPLPRTLLIVDEFQEFFIEEDKVAQDAALLLDRLVRQGRAFGIHVNLGSQTLSGAYSLARSTLGQMAVRIALQCSEADAHLILSEDNAAARLLSRPGEAIYNDANGMVEGNHVFQVVWLSDAHREKYLATIRELARTRDAGKIRPRIVFEGNLPSDLRKNVTLDQLIQADSWPTPPASPRAWLGDAVAIKDPTAAVFRRQGGHHLLVVGQDSDGARGLFGATMLSLCAQYAPGAVRIYLVDPTATDDVAAEVLRSLAARLPHHVKVGGPRELPGFLDELSDDLAQRQVDAAGSPPAFLLLFDAARLRDIRKSDDDFGYSFGKSDEVQKPSPSKQFGELVREGPAVGIHIVTWFDTLNSLQRVLDRTLLREFEMRILFSMSANDSASIIDSPLANRLGPHRALFVTDDQTRLEKFRPYHVPPDDWLSAATARWAGRTKSLGVEP